jgi:uncharacterized protein YbjT (DUF2867 family)
MQVAVVGGTGTLGVPLVAELARRGHAVRVLSRNTPAAPLPGGAVHHPVDLRNGEGIEPALDGAEVLVDAASSRRQARAVMVDGTQRLLETGAHAEVRHHLLISIVGCDRASLSYYRVKTAQEEAVAAGRVPWSILRATQFHDLLAWAFTGAARLRLRPTGLMQLQPVDVALVAGRLADTVEAQPAGRLPDLAGPRVQTLGELSASFARSRGQRLLPLRVPSVGRAGRALRDGALCDEAAAAGGPSFEEWLAR